MNGDETDVDCGGDCGPCGPGQGCIAAEDCMTQSCVNQVCEGGAGGRVRRRDVSTRSRLTPLHL